MSEIFDHSEMSEEDVKPKKITMETDIWNNMFALPPFVRMVRQGIRMKKSLQNIRRFNY
jgi:hypothetical protein